MGGLEEFLPTEEVYAEDEFNGNDEDYFLLQQQEYEYYQQQLTQKRQQLESNLEQQQPQPVQPHQLQPQQYDDLPQQQEQHLEHPYQQQHDDQQHVPRYDHQQQYRQRYDQRQFYHHQYDQQQPFYDQQNEHFHQQYDHQHQVFHQRYEHHQPQLQQPQHLVQHIPQLRPQYEPPIFDEPHVQPFSLSPTSSVILRRRQEEMQRLDERIANTLTRKNSLEFTVLNPHEDEDSDRIPQYDSETEETILDLQTKIRYYYSHDHQRNKPMVWDDEDSDDQPSFGGESEDDRQEQKHHQRQEEGGTDDDTSSSRPRTVSHISANSNLDSLIQAKIEMNYNNGNRMNRATIPLVTYVKADTEITVDGKSKNDEKKKPSVASSRSVAESASSSINLRSSQKSGGAKSTSSSQSKGTRESTTTSASSAMSLTSQLHQLVSTRRTRSIDALERDVHTKLQGNSTATRSPFTLGRRRQIPPTPVFDDSFAARDETSQTFNSSLGTFNMGVDGTSFETDTTDPASTSTSRRGMWTTFLDDFLNEAANNGTIILHDEEDGTKTATAVTVTDARKLAYDKKLAVASPVMDGQLRKDYPNASEYDSNQDPNRKRRIICTVLVLTFCVIGIVVGVTVGVTVISKKHEAEAKKIARNVIHPRETVGIHQFLTSQLRINSTVLNVRTNPDNPYAKAAHWMTYSDPQALVPKDDPRFLQRFLLVYYYFATVSSKLPNYSTFRNNTMENNKGWRFCGPLITNGSYAYQDNENSFNSNPASMKQSDAAILTTTPIRRRSSACPAPKSFMYGFSVQDSEISYTQLDKRWLSQHDECLWMGVICDDQKHVTYIALGEMNLVGTFPDGIRLLPFLSTYIATYNSLHGLIPGQYLANDFKHLVDFQIQGNQFTGTFPQEIINSRNIHHVRMHSNKLRGSLPSKIDTWKDLKLLYVGNNSLAGTIPSTMGRIQGLFYLGFENNNLQGQLPTEIGNLPLLEFYAGGNELNGPIPSQLGLLKKLRTLEVGGNRLSGPIPTELFNLTELQLFGIHENELTGTLSSDVGKLDELVSFQINGNRFHGTIPTELVLLTKLSQILLVDNNFTGSIPSTVCQLNWVKDIEADCLPEGNAAPEITCPTGCCSKCCNPSASVCQLMYN